MSDPFFWLKHFLDTFIFICFEGSLPSLYILQHALHSGVLKMCGLFLTAFSSSAEGYERLARAREEGISMDTGKGNFNASFTNDIIANETDFGGAFSVLDTAVGTSNLNIPSEGALADGDDSLDMFAEDDESAAANPTTDGVHLVSGPDHDRIGQPLESKL